MYFKEILLSFYFFTKPKWNKKVSDIQEKQNRVSSHSLHSKNLYHPELTASKQLKPCLAQSSLPTCICTDKELKVSKLHLFNFVFLNV